MVPSLVKCMYKINAYFNQEESPLLPTPGGYVLGVFVYLSVCLFLCVHTNSKSNKQIFLKFLLWKKKILEISTVTISCIFNDFGFLVDITTKLLRGSF